MVVAEDSLKKLAAQLFGQFTQQQEKPLVEACRVQQILVKIAYETAKAYMTMKMDEACQKMAPKNFNNTDSLHIAALNKHSHLVKRQSRIGRTTKTLRLPTSISPKALKKESGYNQAHELGLVALTDPYWSMPDFWGRETPNRGRNRLQLTVESPRDWCGTIWLV